MTDSNIAATWLVADPSVDEYEIETWCRSESDVRAGVFMVQVATGRGKLSGGRGALVVQASPAGDPPRPAWAVEVIRAEFRLRQVHAPGGEPELATTRSMLLTRTYAPDDMRDEFREWLVTEHSQRQLDVPGNNWYLGYEEVGPRHSFMNFWGIDDPGVADGDAWDLARLTPWRERMVPAMAGMDRGFYRPLTRVRSG
jgi:hypothetical protein